MPFSLITAKNLIGKSRDEYQCNHVVNEVFFGSKTSNSYLAKNYLSLGQKVNAPRAGVVVVGKDRKHIGVFISENRFIHSSSTRKEVIEVGLDQLQYAFPNGYELRDPDRK